MIREAIERLSGGQDLTIREMEAAMEEIMSGKALTPLIVSFLTALNKKGETAEELTAAASVMRRYATRIKTNKKIVLDTCGTGADAKGTFNVSTAAAFVVAGSGITVAKHGNRSVSSCCGSADILENLGININMSVPELEECLNEIGIAFLFAQNLHPAMKYAMPARKQIGSRTIFNILGPLTNPAAATHQLIGVYDRHWTEVLAQVLASLGTVHALVVHGEDGLDEVTTTSGTLISEAYKGKIKNYRIFPEDLGFKRAVLADLAGGTVADNARILLGILSGEGGSKRDIVLLNAASAIYAADRAGSIQEGIELAKVSIDSKKAWEKFEALKNFSLPNHGKN